MLIKLEVIGLHAVKNVELSFVNPSNSKQDLLTLKNFAAISGANACGKTHLLTGLQKLQTCLARPIPSFCMFLVVNLASKIYEYQLEFDANSAVIRERLTIEIENSSLMAIDRNSMELESDFDDIRSIELCLETPALANDRIQAPEILRFRDWIDRIKLFDVDLMRDRDVDDLLENPPEDLESITDFINKFDLKFDWSKVKRSELSTGERKMYAIGSVLADPNLQLLVWDDLDAYLHPLLVDGILNYCRDRRIQLIFTFHSPYLFGRLDREDIWLLEKGELYSVVEFKIPQGINLERAYLEGRFGAVPFLNSQILPKNTCPASN